MSATVKAILRTERKKADGTCQVYVRVTVNRRTTKYPTGIFVTEADWNEKRAKVRASHELADAYNRRIQAELDQVRVTALDAPTAKAVVKSVKKGSAALVGDLDDLIAEFKSQGKVWEAKHFAVLKSKLVACFGESVRWTDLDSGALVRFEAHLRDVDRNADNTIRNHLKRLGRLFRQEVEKGTVSQDADPFRGYRRPKKTPVNKRRLKREEMTAIEALTYPPGSAKRIAQDAFLFSFFASGVRFGDLCALKNENIIDGRLYYQMMKTQQQVSLKLPSEALQIAAEYPINGWPCLFPYLREHDLKDGEAIRKRISTRNVIANRNLKLVAKDAGLDPDGLTMHVARHSFADHARTSGGDLYAISKALGHSNIQITEQYLSSFDQDAVDDLVDSIF